MTDLRFAVRQLVKNAGFASVAVLTLALGIGANTAIFSVVNAVLLRPLPYPESERLVWLSERGPNFPVMSIAYPDFTDWLVQQEVFEHLGVYNWVSYSLTGRGEPVRLDLARISAGALEALRVPPVLGRTFTKADDNPAATPTVLLSHALWQNRFGSDRTILDQSISLDGRPFTVLGVMPPDFAFPSRVDAWVPVGLSASESSFQSRDNHPGLLGVARPEYFRVLGIPVVRGRGFTEHDNLDYWGNLPASSNGQPRPPGMNVVVIDEEFARRHWPNQDPLGRGIRANGAAMTVVGVVRRTKIRALDEQGGFVQAYFSALQSPSRGRTVILRTTLPPEELMPAVRQQVMAMDPSQPVYAMQTLSELRDRSLMPRRLNLALLVLFAGVALALAVIGLYGVLAYAVTQRTREIGIRMALGAQRSDVLTLVISQGMKLALVGAVLGMLGALALTRTLTTLLFEITPTDPWTLVATPLLLLCVAMLACWLPARRAAKVDPMEALRAE